MEVPQLKELDKKLCASRKIIQNEEKVSVPDTIATTLDLEPKQDIGLVENGKKVYVPVGFL